MYKFSPNVRRTAADRDGSIVLDVRQGKILKINSIGVLIWEMLDCRMTKTEIVDALCVRFPEQPKEIIQTDVDAFVAELTKQHILQSRSIEAEPGV